MTFPGDPLDYPGQAPKRSWMLDKEGRVSWIDTPPDSWWKERSALLAIGSNRRPGRLSEHLKGLDRSACGLKVTLRGADIVYPSHVSGYGVCTSTAIACPEAIIESWLLLVTQDQLSILREREGAEGFGLCHLDAVIAETGKRQIEAPLAFVHLQGPLAFQDGRPRALAGVSAVKGPLVRVVLDEAHKRIEELLGEDISWPAATPETIDRRLSTLGLPLCFEPNAFA